MAGKLYIVGTPIGNLEDMSPRVARILSQVDFIAAEDTRNSVKLLNHLDIKKEMISYFEHNRMSRGELIIARIEGGESCALVTDAGMPAVSDPGSDLVRLCHERGIESVVIPGPCAAVCALALSGMVGDRFAFEGFLPTSGVPRRTRIAALADEERTVILYEAPHRMARTLRELYDALGDRRVCVVKEITKIHETADYTTLSAAALAAETNAARGEYVLVLEGATVTEYKASDEELLQMLREAVGNGASRADAVKQAAERSGAAKNRVYRLMNSLEE